MKFLPDNVMDERDCHFIIVNIDSRANVTAVITSLRQLNSNINSGDEAGNSDRWRSLRRVQAGFWTTLTSL